MSPALSKPLAPASRSVLVLVTLLAVSATAAPEPKAGFSAEVVPAQVRRGETVELRLRAKVDKGWHIYSPTTNPDGAVPTTATLKESPGFEPGGKLTGPPAEKHFDEGFGFEVEYYPGDVEFSLPVRVRDSAELGDTQVAAQVEYMACSDLTCTPPLQADVTAAATVVEGAPRPQYAGKVDATPPAQGETPAAPETAPSEVDQAIRKGFWSFAWLAVTMGFVALLTPCVFPMIPITVSFFTSQESRTRAQAIGMAATYAGGIVVTYTALGLILALTLGATGANQLAASVWFNLFVTVLFAAFALSMLGLFELRLPSSMLQFSTKQQARGGLLGVLFMSLTFALVSFSCTVQFVGLLLVAASHGEWTWPALGMALFSGALALPFFFLALFPRFLQALPKSGEWMESVKVVMGFVLLAVATKFFSNVDSLWGWGLLNRSLVLALWTCSFLLAGAYLLGKIRLAGHGAPEGIGTVRLLIGMAFLSLALYLGAGLAGQPLQGWVNAYLPVAEETHATVLSQGEKRQWLSSYQAALDEAKRTGKPLFLDFTGHTCTNCRWMEANIFPASEVSALFEEFVLARLLTDMGPEAKENRELQVDRFGTTALPLYVILSPGGEEVARSPGLTKDRSVFAAFLRSGLSKAAGGG